MTNEQALLAIADALEAAAKVARRAVSSANGTDAGDMHSATERLLKRARELHPSLGPLQARGLEQLASAEPRGLTNRQVSDLLEYDGVNTHQMLNSLRDAGLVHRDDSVSPITYRLGSALRDL